MTGATMKRGKVLLAGSVRADGRTDTISVCNLYSGSLFLLPCIVLHNHGFRLLPVQSAAVCGLSLIFHRQSIATTCRVNGTLRAFDILNSALGVVSVMWYSWEHFWSFTLICLVPVFWAIEHVMLARGHFVGHLAGVAGVHVLCHLSAIISCCILPGPTWEDLYPAALGCVAAFTVASLSEPDILRPPASMAERRLAWAGVHGVRNIQTHSRHPCNLKS